MGLSNVTGASSILQPGVCTSSTRPASPYDGQVIYETDTDKVAVYDSSSWVYKTGTAHIAPALVLIKTQTIGTTVSSVEVTGAFSATYDNYQIIISGGLGSIDTADLKLTLGATVAGYNDQLVAGNYTSSGVFVGGTSGSSFRYAGTSNGATLFMNTFLENPFLTKVTLQSGSFVTSSIAGSSFGYLANNTSYTAFTITPSSGTITGGTIRVYGYLNS